MSSGGSATSQASSTLGSAAGASRREWRSRRCRLHPPGNLAGLRRAGLQEDPLRAGAGNAVMAADLASCDRPRSTTSRTLDQYKPQRQQLMQVAGRGRDGGVKYLCVVQSRRTFGRRQPFTDPSGTPMAPDISVILRARRPTRDGPSREGPAAGHRSRPSCPSSREGARAAGLPHGMHARLRRSPHAGIRRQRGPSVAVREKPTVSPDRPGGTDAVRYASVDIATYRPAVTHCDTRRDEKETAPQARFRSRGPFP